MKLAKKMNKTILITGASTGIGRYVAEYFAGQNHRVYAGARKNEDIVSLSNIPNITGLKLDVTKKDDINYVKSVIENDIGSLDVLINNAGIIGWGAVIDRDLDYFRKIFEVNLFGIIYITKVLYPLLKVSVNHPIIINVSSQGGSYTFPYWTPYSMTKYALESFTDGLRRELNSQGIRVSLIKPGAITSEAFKKQINSLKEYRSQFKSEFSENAATLFEMGMNRPREKEKSPFIVVKDIEHAIFNANSKIRYHSGRRMIPDLMMSKLPDRWVDKIFQKFFNI